MEKHKALSQEHYSKMDALEEAYQVKHISGLLPVIEVMDWIEYLCSVGLFDKSLN